MDITKLTFSESIEIEKRKREIMLIKESEKDEPKQNQTCEIGTCNGEVYIACPFCYRFLCFEHVESECKDDHEGENVNDKLKKTKQNKINRSNVHNIENEMDNCPPESFKVDGNQKEGNQGTKRKRGLNKKKYQKTNVTKVKNM